MTGVKFLCPVAIRQGDLQKKSGGRSSKVWDLRRSAQRIFRGELISWSTSFMTIVTNITGAAPPFIYPVVRRELRSYGYSYSLLHRELRSYQEFPNHILVILIFSKLIIANEFWRYPPASEPGQEIGHKIMTSGQKEVLNHGMKYRNIYNLVMKHNETVCHWKWLI